MTVRRRLISRTEMYRSHGQRRKKSGRSYFNSSFFILHTCLGREEMASEGGEKSFPSQIWKGRRRGGGGGKTPFREKRNKTHKKQKKEKGKYWQLERKKKQRRERKFSLKKRPPPDRKELTNIFFWPKKSTGNRAIMWLVNAFVLPYFPGIALKTCPFSVIPQPSSLARRKGKGGRKKKMMNQFIRLVFRTDAGSLRNAS